MKEAGGATERRLTIMVISIFADIAAAATKAQ